MRLCVCGFIVFVSPWLFGQQLWQGQGMTGSVSAWGLGALGANPSGLVYGGGRWEFGVPALAAGMAGLTLREYNFYFGGVRTPSGWQPRRLGLAERQELSRIVEERPVRAWLQVAPIALVWHPDGRQAVGVEQAVWVWLRAQLPEGTQQLAQRALLGADADTLELRGGELTVRMYSSTTVAYARHLRQWVWDWDTASVWHRSRLVGGLALHVYRGHAFLEALPGAWLRLVSSVPPGWDSTVNWIISGAQGWGTAGGGFPWLLGALGLAPAVGWGLGVSLGGHWGWAPSDTAEPVAMVGLSLEHVGFCRWNITVSRVEVVEDTITGVLGSVWEELQRRYTPSRGSESRLEMMPGMVRIGGAVELAALGIGIPVRLAAELGYGFGAAWTLRGLRGGVGAVFRSGNTLLPWIAAGVAWGWGMELQVTGGLRWVVPVAGRVRTALEVALPSLLGWLLPGKARQVGLGVRLSGWL